MYEGEWKENMREGYGIYHFKNGRIYKGQFKNNNIDGYGEFTWPEGKKYYGFYKNDKKDGFVLLLLLLALSGIFEARFLSFGFSFSSFSAFISTGVSV